MHALVVIYLGYVAVAIAQLQEPPTPAIISAAVINDDNNTGGCPSDTLLQASRNMLKEEVKTILLNNLSHPICGDGEWNEVIKFDLTNSSETCPQPWAIVTSPTRLCAASSCQNSAIFNVAQSYSRVCGEVIGYASGYPDAFKQHFISNPTIDVGYLDGVSITHGSPRQHIWSLAVGHGTGIFGDFFRCPCDNDNTLQAPDPPMFVQDNYFCDGRQNGLLWDGQGCTSACCTFHSPPWFNTTLPAPTSDDIEVRICSDESFSDERVYIKKMVLLVQ